MYTREEFERLRREWARQMSGDLRLRQKALEVLSEADHYNWFHLTNWFGEPVLQLPHDMFAIQEIMFETRPRYIVETGVAWGGSLLFYSTLMHALGGERIIGVDIYMPDDLRKRIGAFGPISDRITLINGSSVDASTVDQIRTMIGDSHEVLVILDSNHTHEHVLKELRLYSGFVGLGQYLVCGDTIVEDMPAQTHRPRPWGPGNNPQTALEEFLRDNDGFELDRALESKLLFTGNPRGYLRRHKE